MMTLTDKTVVITGGAGLLGISFSDAVAAAGANIVIAEKSEEGGKRAADLLSERYGQQVVYFPVDITSESSIQTLIAGTYEKFGRIDALVNNAYPRNKNYGKKFEEVTYRDFSENVSMHLGGYFLTAQHFINYFSKQGHGNIISLASIYGVVAPRFEIYHNTDMTMPVEYAVIKSGIIHLTKYMTRYTKGKNIRCNCISPGGIFNNQPESFVEGYSDYSSGKGMLSPNDLCGTLLFLLSDESAFINGQNIVVDDGWSL